MLARGRKTLGEREKLEKMEQDKIFMDSLEKESMDMKEQGSVLKKERFKPKAFVGNKRSKLKQSGEVFENNRDREREKESFKYGMQSR